MPHTAEVEPTDAPAPGPLPALPAAGPVPLGYAGLTTPLPRFRRFLRNLYDLGPLFPWPSVPTLVLFVACAGAAYWLSHRPQPWRLVRSYAVPPSNGHFPNLHYLPRADALVSSNATGGLSLWRPWTGEDLSATVPPPAALPPNPPPGLKGQSWRVTASADESKLLAKSDLGEFLWDARNGGFLADLSTYLGPGAAKRPGFSLGGLSPDGSRLCVVNDKDELLLYDITAPAGRLLARRQLTRPPYPLHNPPGTPSVVEPRSHLRFSPDGKHVLLVGDTMLWLGDAEMLEPRVVLRQYASPTDAAFLDGGRRLLLGVGGPDDPHEVRLYDTASGVILRRWPALQDLSALNVSPDGRHAVATSGYDVPALVIDLSDGAAPAARLPHGNWLYWPPAFFPDGRRVVLTDAWRKSPGVYDLATGRHVANLHPTAPAAEFGRPIVSPDGRFVALFSPRTSLDVYEQVGRESAWGVIASPRLWALVACVVLLVASLCRDAWAARRRRGRTVRMPRPRAALAALLAASGAGAVLCPFVWLALGMTTDRDLDVWWFDDGWLVWLLVLYLPAGMGLIAGSRLWSVLLVVLLPASAAVALWLIPQAAEFATRPVRIGDRMWLINPSWMIAFWVSWAALGLAGLLALAGRPVRSSAGG